MIMMAPMNNLQILINSLGESMRKNSPTIFTTLAVLGVGSTTLLAIKATGPAIKDLDQFEADWANFYDHPDGGERWVEISALDRLKVVAPYYIPTFVSAALTISFILASNKINMGRNAALATLYTASEKALYDYQTQAEELFGKRKAEKLQESVAQKRLDENPTENVHIHLTGKGEHLCYDSWSGRYFRGDIETIRRAENEFNADILQGDGFKTLNEFYADIGLDPVEGGQQMGWSIDTELLKIRFTAKITSEGEPCIVIEFPINPRYI